MIILFTGSCLPRETRHTVGFSKEKYFFSKGKTQGTKRHCIKNSLKSIMLHFNYHFLIKSKKTTKNCLTKALLGHHYHFPYLICAHHLKHSCPEPAVPGRILIPHEGIWFWSGVCQEGQNSAQPQPGAGEGGSACGPPHGSRQHPCQGLLCTRGSFAHSIHKCYSQSCISWIRRVTVNYLCLEQKRKDIFTESQG